MQEWGERLYARYDRWLLGAVLGLASPLGSSLLALTWSFLAGSVIRNVLRRKLPEANRTCYLSFLSGCGAFALILIPGLSSLP